MVSFITTKQIEDAILNDIVRQENLQPKPNDKGVTQLQALTGLYKGSGEIPRNLFGK